MPPETAQSFENVDVWIFDLDNTLYPAHCNLFAQVDVRMGEFISNLLGVDRAEAKRIQKSYFKEYGTTLNGLMNCHNMAPEPFLDYVHDIDVGVVDPDELLNTTLGQLQGTKYVFTNGSVRHAENVLGRLGIQHHFADIFDIVAADYVPKPAPDTYTRFLEATSVDPRRSAMFEDIARNLEHPHTIGMTTVLVRSPEDKREQHFNEWDGRRSRPATCSSRDRGSFRISCTARGTQVTAIDTGQADATLRALFHT